VGTEIYKVRGYAAHGARRKEGNFSFLAGVKKVMEWHGLIKMSLKPEETMSCRKCNYEGECDNVLSSESKFSRSIREAVLDEAGGGGVWRKSEKRLALGKWE